MKKTIIALLALGSMAMADVVLTDAVMTLGSAETKNFETTDVLYHDSTVTMSMELDIAALKSALETSGVQKKNYLLGNFSVALNSTANGDAGALVIYTSSSASNKTSSIWASGNKSTGSANVGGATYLSTLLESDAWANATGAALTLSVKVADNADEALTGIYLTLADKDGNLTEYSNTTNAIRWSSFNPTYGVTGVQTGELTKKAYIFNTDVTATNAKALNAAILPEPATATLSLLALAGLAARRRRH